jgi:hypothetical protein
MAAATATASTNRTTAFIAACREAEHLSIYKQNAFINWHIIIKTYVALLVLRNICSLQ